MTIKAQEGDWTEPVVIEYTPPFILKCYKSNDETIWELIYTAKGIILSSCRGLPDLSLDDALEELIKELIQ